MNTAVVDTLCEVLQAFESAPSAHILVKSFVDPTVVNNDALCEEIYNSSEGYNDSETRSIITSFNQAQLDELVAHLKVVAQDTKDNEDPDVFQEYYQSALDMLNTI